MSGMRLVANFMDVSTRRLNVPTGKSLLAVTGLGCAAITIGVLAADPKGLRVAIATAAALLFLAVGMHRPQHLLYAVVGWLGLLGLLRRIATDISTPSGADPLLLVAPFALLALFVASTAKRSPLAGSALTKAVAVLAGLVLLGALNPLQGGLAAGGAGLLFLLVPLLAYWVGREFCGDTALTVVFKIIAVLAVPAALYGLVQALNGFPSWDAQWIRAVAPHYVALTVGGTTRPFSMFSGAAEFGYFLGVAIVVWLVFGWRRHRVVAVAVSALLLTTILYESNRAVLVALTVALALIVAARRGLAPSTAIAAGMVAIIVLPIAVSQFVSSDERATGGSALVAHQVSGLAHPFDPQSSTLLIHLALVSEGVQTGFSHPLGLGTGSVTLAAQRFGAEDRNSEADPSNAATALGIPGFLAYIVVFVLGLSRAYSVAERRRDPLALAALGVLIVLLFQWLNGGQYAVAFIPWLVLGWLERDWLSKQEASRDEQPSPTSE